jgi:lysyl-tRNA synthetase class 2
VSPTRAVAGRVLAVDDRGLTLQKPGGETMVLGLGRDHGLQVGDLVRLHSDGALERAFVHPTHEWPGPQSDGMRYLDGAKWSRLRARGSVFAGTRAFFTAAGFLEVETPLVVESAGTEVHIDPTRVRQRSRPGADTEDRFLIPSPEHHMKRLICAGAPPIFSLGPVWRDGEAGDRHRPEFTLLEWYRPWASLEAIFEDTQAWLQALHPGPTLTYQGRRLPWSGTWPRHAFLDLLSQRAGVSAPERLTPDEQLVAFVDGVESTLGMEQPEFVVDYPVAFASLAQRQPGEPELAERFELYVAGLELANAFGELTDAAEQRTRCEADNEARRAAGRDVLPLDEPFLSALAEGMPPTAGIAVGMDRVVMLLADAATIDEVRAF